MEIETEADRSEQQGKWKNTKPLLKPGYHLLSGNEACAFGAFDAGCRFFAGYPITPATEILDQFTEFEANNLDAIALQMEDEIAALSAVIGASLAGTKSMTATSGPGFSLMQENIGYAVITETPCVIIDVQRAGPSTGQPTRPAFGDLKQAIWGSHGDSPKIVLAPTSVQECYDLTILAFNISQLFKTPVIILTDEILAHLKEKIKIPSRSRIFTNSQPCLGDGAELTITGATHRFNGDRATVDSVAQSKLIKSFQKKMEAINSYTQIDEISVDPDAKFVFIACGFTVRSVKAAIERLSDNKNNKIGLIVIKKLWPFPFRELRQLKERLGKNTLVIVPEMSQRQLFHSIREIFRYTASYSQTDGLPIAPQKLIEEMEKWGVR